MSQPQESAADAAERAAQAVATGNLAALMSLITPEALAQVMTMSQQAGGVSLTQMPQITGYNIMPAGEADGSTYYDVTFTSEAGTVTLRAGWKVVLAQWKIASIEVLSAEAAPGQAFPAPPSPPSAEPSQ